MRRAIKWFSLFLVFQTTLGAQNDLYLSSPIGLPFQVIYNDSVINHKSTANVVVEGITEDTVTLVLKTQNLQDTVTVYLMEKRKPVSNKEFLYEVVEEKKQLRVKYASINDRSGVGLVVAKPPEVVPVKIVPRDFGSFAEIKSGHVTFFDHVPPGGCKKAMSDEQFNQAKTILTQDKLRDDKLTLIEKTLTHNCVDMAQLQYLIELVSFELDRVKLIKKAAPNVVDRENYKSLEKSFKLQSAYKKVQDIFNERPSRFKLTDTCKTATEQSNIEKLTDQLKSSDNDKARLLLIKDQGTKHCFLVSQVKPLLNTFLHDRERVEASKLLYRSTIDKKNYSTLGDDFTFPQWLNEFKSFIHSHQEN